MVLGPELELRYFAGGFQDLIISFSADRNFGMGQIGHASQQRFKFPVDVFQFSSKLGYLVADGPHLCYFLVRRLAQRLFISLGPQFFYPRDMSPAVSVQGQEPVNIYLSSPDFAILLYQLCVLADVFDVQHGYENNSLLASTA